MNIVHRKQIFVFTRETIHLSLPQQLYESSHTRLNIDENAWVLFVAVKLWVFFCNTIPYWELIFTFLWIKFYVRSNVKYICGGNSNTKKSDISYIPLLSIPINTLLGVDWRFISASVNLFTRTEGTNIISFDILLNRKQIICCRCYILLSVYKE